MTLYMDEKVLYIVILATCYSFADFYLGGECDLSLLLTGTADISIIVKNESWFHSPTTSLQNKAVGGGTAGTAMV